MSLQLKYADRWQPTGSRVICDPPPVDTDDDYIVLTRDHELFEDAQTEMGFTRTNSAKEGYPDDGVRTYRMGVLNLIVTDSEVYYSKWLLAAQVASALNLMEKRDRITVFEIIVDDRWTQ